MYYLVTGGCGFIGSHLVERLLGGGHAVTVIDDLSSGKKEHIPAHVPLLARDITAPGAFDDVVGKADGCFHLAAVVSVQPSETVKARAHQVNLGGTVALFDALRHLRRNIPVIFASSAAVYGDCGDLPLKETAACNPLSAYGADKLTGESHVRIAALEHGIPAMALRFFNVYGPRQDPSSPYSGVISIFADRLKRHEPVTIYGDGGQTRDFIHVSDVVEGMLAAMRRLESGESAHAVVNICTGDQTSINELAQMVGSLAQSRSEILHAPPRAGDISFSAGDPSLGKELLEFTAVIGLNDGLKQMLGASSR